jgi:hypothetical protein
LLQAPTKQSKLQEMKQRQLESHYEGRGVKKLQLKEPTLPASLSPMKGCGVI